jgi:hypothetical protein
MEIQDYGNVEIPRERVREGQSTLRNGENSFYDDNRAESSEENLV